MTPRTTMHCHLTVVERTRGDRERPEYQNNPYRTLLMKAVAIWVTLLGLLVSEACAANSRPNIVLILIDDLGCRDFSCFGDTEANTPNIDRLAAEGIRFSQFYVNSPICSPSRVAITTGQYPQRWRITSFLNNRDENEKRGMAHWLDPNAHVLAHMLKQDDRITITSLTPWPGQTV